MKGKIRLMGKKSSLTKKGFPIIFYLTQDSKEKIIPTGFYAYKKDWDSATALPRKTHPEFLLLLNYLEIKKIKLQRLVAESMVVRLSFSYVKSKLLAVDSGCFYRDGMDFIESHELKRTYRVALKAFNDCFTEYPYDQIDDGVVAVFRVSLMSKKVNNRPRSENGVTSYMATLAALWNKLQKPNNPFARAKKIKVPTASKAMSVGDVRKIAAASWEQDPKAKYGSVAHYINYWLLCFYLGGIDMVDLVNARYDKNVVNGRFEFVRSKGGTNVPVSNKIFDQARQIMDIYDCKPYVIPVRSFGSDSNMMLANVSRRYGDIKNVLGLTKKPYSKAPRYTFINRSRELLVDERICIEIVGHSQSSTHSIYKDEFSYGVRDAAHLKVIDLE